MFFHAQTVLRVRVLYSAFFLMVFFGVQCSQGYIQSDSNDVNGPTYSWIDIGFTGEEVIGHNTATGGAARAHRFL